MPKKQKSAPVRRPKGPSLGSGMAENARKALRNRRREQMKKRGL